MLIPLHIFDGNHYLSQILLGLSAAAAGRPAAERGAADRGSALLGDELRLQGEGGLPHHRQVPRHHRRSHARHRPRKGEENFRH